MNFSEQHRPFVPSVAQNRPKLGEPQEMRSETKPMEYRICVTGAPKYVRSHEVAEYFSAFGPIRVRRFNPPIGKPKVWKGGQVRQGPTILRHFILITDSENTYDSILKFKTFTFNGRSLGVIPIRTGWELKKHYERINRRKIILKKVPSEITIDALRELIESRYGPVETMYEFLTDRREIPAITPTETPDQGESNSNGKKRFKSYSLVFESLDSLALLPEGPRVILKDDISIIIELHHKVSKVKVHMIEAEARSLKAANTASTDKRNQIQVSTNTDSISDWRKESKLKPGNTLLAKSFAPTSTHISKPLSNHHLDPSIVPTRRVYYINRNTPQEINNYSPSGHPYRFNIL